jgi:DNA-binding CsgD family transcriptional regulator
MKSYKHKNPFTARQQAAILRLYVQQRVPSRETAKRLRFPVYLVKGFLRKGGVMGHQGRPPGTGGKLSLADRQNLEGELATTMDVVLARKYRLSRGRIGQIRQQLGCPSSRVVRRAWAARARAKRRKQEKLALELRQRQRRAKRLLAVNRLSKCWKSGMLVAKLAQELGYTRKSVYKHIGRLRKQFPEKFPFRKRPYSHLHLEEVR